MPTPPRPRSNAPPPSAIALTASEYCQAKASPNVLRSVVRQSTDALDAVGRQRLQQGVELRAAHVRQRDSAESVDDVGDGVGCGGAGEQAGRDGRCVHGTTLFAGACLGMLTELRRFASH